MSHTKFMTMSKFKVTFRGQNFVIIPCLDYQYNFTSYCYILLLLGRQACRIQFRSMILCQRSRSHFEVKCQNFVIHTLCGPLLLYTEILKLGNTYSLYKRIYLLKPNLIYFVYLRQMFSSKWNEINTTINILYMYKREYRQNQNQSQDK